MILGRGHKGHHKAGWLALILEAVPHNNSVIVGAFSVIVKTDGSFEALVVKII